MVSRLDLQISYCCCASAGLATPREWPSRELGTRFGGLMADSYTRERLSGSEEVPDRGLGKDAGGRKHSRPCVQSFAPLKLRA